MTQNEEKIDLYFQKIHNETTKWIMDELLDLGFPNISKDKKTETRE